MEWLAGLPKGLALLQQYPLWVRWIFIFWMVVTATLIAAMVVSGGGSTASTANQPSSAKSGQSATLDSLPESNSINPSLPAAVHSKPDTRTLSPEGRPESGALLDSASSEGGASPATLVGGTGDNVIDGVERNLLNLKSSGSYSEAAVVEAMRPLFARPAFYGSREEDWNYFVYAVCRTRLLLEQNRQYFRSSKEVVNDIDKVIALLMKLQDDSISVYPSTFSITEHIDRYIRNKRSFIDKLPTPVKERSVEFYNARDKTIRDLRGALTPLGLL